MFKFTISSYSGKTKVVLPVLTEDSFSIDYGSAKNQTHDSIKHGEIKTIGKKPLASVSVTSFFPSHQYSFLTSGAKTKSKAPYNNYVKKLRDLRDKGKPVRLVITNGKNNSIFNRLMTIENFTINNVDTAGDYHYSLSFEEYRKVK